MQEEANIERKPTLAKGEQVSMAPVDKSQRQLADVIQYVQEIGKMRSPTGLAEEELAPLRETLGLAWGQICILLDPAKKKVPSDTEDDMQDVPNEQRAAKTQRTSEDQELKLSARQAAQLRGDDMSDDEEDVVAEAWTRIGSDKARKEFESYCRQLQVSSNEVVAGKAERIWNRTQSLGKAKVKAKARGTPSPAGQPSPGTPRATQWDARSGHNSKVPPGQEAEYPPLPASATRAAPGTPAQAKQSGTQSPTGMPLAAGDAQSSPAGNAPPAQGTGSGTAASSASVPQPGAPAAPPAEGPGIEGGDGSPA